MTARKQEKEAVTLDDLFDTTTGGFLATGEEIDRVQRRLGHILRLQERILSSSEHLETLAEANIQHTPERLVTLPDALRFGLLMLFVASAGWIANDLHRAKSPADQTAVMADSTTQPKGNDQ